jgi:hypothetical protein
VPPKKKLIPMPLGHPRRHVLIERRADERQVLHLDAGDQKLGQHRNRRQVERADERIPRENPIDIFRRALAGRMPGMKPPYFRMFSAGRSD